jgi:hypothetical protein
MYDHPEHFGQIDQIEQQDGHIFIHDGTVRYAVRAMNPSDSGGSQNLKFERIDNYLLIVLDNYNGKLRQFSSEELQRTLNSFVFNITLCAEESAEDFRQRILNAQCLDYWYFGTRTIRYQNNETQFEINYAPGNEHVRYASISGQLHPSPTWQADGLPACRPIALPKRTTSKTRTPLPLIPP